MVTSEEGKKENSDTDTLIVKIINEKCTRLGKIYEVKNTKNNATIIALKIHFLGSK